MSNETDVEQVWGNEITAKKLETIQVHIKKGQLGILSRFDD